MTDQDELRQRRDANGVALPDALADHGVDLDHALDARTQLENAAAYLELHIEQGPVLESLALPLGVVLGTFRGGSPPGGGGGGGGGGRGGGGRGGAGGA